MGKAYRREARKSRVETASRIVENEAGVMLTVPVDLADLLELSRERAREVSLTCIGGWSPLYVDGSIRGNSFTVRGAEGAKPDQEFSWLVYGVRNDAFARANPVVVEEEKGMDQPNAIAKGEYLNAQAYGKPSRRRRPGGSERNQTAPDAQEAKTEPPAGVER